MQTEFNSFGAKFRTTFIVCVFIFFKLALGKTFICKVERLHVKQRRFRWDGSMSRLIWIYAICEKTACGSEIVNVWTDFVLIHLNVKEWCYTCFEDFHADRRTNTYMFLPLWKLRRDLGSHKASLSPSPKPILEIYYWLFQCCTFIVVLFVKYSVVLQIQKCLAIM